MQILEAIDGMDYSVEKDMLKTLIAHLGDGVYYDVNSLAWVMECAANLYLAAKRSNSIYDATVDEHTHALIQSKP